MAEKQFQAFRLQVPGEWDEFARRNSDFVSHFPVLYESIEKINRISRTFTEERESVIFFCLRASQEDFFEVILLAGQGHGSGALARIRTMYERIVHARYFMRFPKRFDDYLAFDIVSRRKLINEAKELFPDMWTTEQLNKFHTEYESTVQRFGSKGKLNASWNEGLGQMAKAVGLGELYLYCYLLPSQYIHVTPNGILSSRGRGEEYNWGPERELCDLATSHAHALLVIALLESNDFLSAGLETDLQVLKDSCHLVWGA